MGWPGRDGRGKDPGVEELKREVGRGQLSLARGKPTMTESVEAASAWGKLILSGVVPVPSIYAPPIRSTGARRIDLSAGLRVGPWVSGTPAE